MPGKRPDWSDKRILQAAKVVTQKYMNGEFRNRWAIEVEFHKVTGYSQRFSTIMKYARES